MTASSSASSGSGPLTEVPDAAIPGARGLPNRSVVREVALVGVPGELRLLRSGRVVKSLRVGSGSDVVAAEHVGGPLLADVAPGSLGAIDLIDPGGERVARLDLRDWVPEAEELSRPDEALRRSGLVPVLEGSGLPLRPVATSELAGALDATPPRLLPLQVLPLSYTVLRSAAVVVAVVALVGGVIGRSPDVVWPIAGGALLASTVVALALWAAALVRDRSVEGDAPEVGPVPSVPVTRRFRRTARLRLGPDAVVVIDAFGRERRLLRNGWMAVTTVAVVRQGTPTAQVELRTAAGVPRATLPWEFWFGGEGGEAALVRACAAGGLLLERGAAPAQRPRVEEEAARAVFSPPDRQKVARSTWPHGLPGQAAVWQTAPLAGFLLLYATLGSSSTVTWPLLLATLALTLVPHLVRLAVRRMWLDVPGRGA